VCVVDVMFIHTATKILDRWQHDVVL
jgi:hypothetical protein